MNQTHLPTEWITKVCHIPAVYKEGFLGLCKEELLVVMLLDRETLLGSTVKLIYLHFSALIFQPPLLLRRILQNKSAAAEFTRLILKEFFCIICFLVWEEDEEFGPRSPTVLRGDDFLKGWCTQK